jgi:UDP-N-acetylglucosamine diphosphorylase / glucose-1-phosphate thymidylyltransferase / UDP-N-acetylgalactosamine diphosphorylase / glucosamine-1-phosphate N-acetyltransferase / galactosamine-1-phosphate N-acetyltransferase
MLNIVIPMAGEGSRFVASGFKTPKPFINVIDAPMIVKVLENLYYPEARYILIVRKEHLEENEEIVSFIKKNFNVVIIPIDKVTEGTACTVLYARKYINNGEPLLIANSDQIVDTGIVDFIHDCKDRKLDGSIMTFVEIEKDPKWSYVKIDDNSLVTKVKEKEVISNYATVGIYFFIKGRFFVDSAIDMIISNDRVNNEFYTCPSYNYAINMEKLIGIYNIDYGQMHGLGTPEDLNIFIEQKSKR